MTATDPRAILLFLFGDLGDTILTVPAIRALRNRYPKAKLVLVGKSPAIEYMRALDLIDASTPVDKHAFDSPLMHPAALLSLAQTLWRIRRHRADTAVLFGHLVTRWGALKYGLLSLASGAGTRVGLENGRGRWFLTKSVLDRGFGACHEAEYRLQIAGLLGARGDLELEAPITEDDRRAADQLLPVGQYLAVHPGVGWFGPGRQWGGENFAAAARGICEQAGLRCVVVGTASDAGEAGELARQLPNAVNLAGRTSVGELAAVLRKCLLLISNDSGVAHLSAAVGTPVVAVFGPSNERAWKPLLGKVMHAGLVCRPCFYRDFETGSRTGCANRECLARISPFEVAQAALELIKEPAFAG